MMKKIKKFPYYVLLAVSLFIAACSSEPLSMDDNATTVEYPVNSAFEIELPANPSTGYKWQIVAYDTNIIRQVSGPDYSNVSEEAGAASLVTFKFKTRAAGNTTLWMAQTRKGLQQGEEIKTFKLNIISGTAGRITAD